MQTGRDERAALYQTELTARAYVDMQLNIAREKYAGKIAITGLDEAILQNRAKTAEIGLKLKQFNFSQKAMAAQERVRAGTAILRAGGSASKGKLGDVPPEMISKMLTELRADHMSLSVYAGHTVTQDKRTGKVRIVEDDASKFKRLGYKALREKAKGEGILPDFVQQVVR